jgi:hypothetical protein
MYVVVVMTDTIDLAPLAVAACAIPAGLVIRHFLLVRPHTLPEPLASRHNGVPEREGARPMRPSSASIGRVVSPSWRSLGRFRKEAAPLSSEPCEPSE